MKEKLKNFSEQYEIREKHFETQLRAKDLENQLLEAKLLQQQNQLATREMVSLCVLFQIFTSIHRTKFLLKAMNYRSAISSKQRKN
jgi:hypothetical protein